MKKKKGPKHIRDTKYAVETDHKKSDNSFLSSRRKGIVPGKSVACGPHFPKSFHYRVNSMCPQAFIKLRDGPCHRVILSLLDFWTLCFLLVNNNMILMN
mmetsp:Transcript_35296/g.73485  ORF Transcript_35296/g.73485 Transcript_35296/m.73485 type:complete len:99 (+) Transcript_35296:555-851(+)